MTSDVIPKRGEGSFGGALSFPWWEVAGRLAIGLWFLLPGLLFLVGEMWRLLGPEQLMLSVLLASAAFGCLQVFAGILSLAGRFGLSGFLLSVILVMTLFRRFLPGEQVPNDGAATGLMIEWLTILLMGSGLVWILGRRLARFGRPLSLQKAAGMALAGAFVLSIPMTGYGMGTSIGMLLSPPIVAARTVAGQRLTRSRVRALDGDMAQLSDAGVVYVVNFWATWCGPCRKELPKLLALSQGWPKDAPIRLVAVNTENLDRQAITAFLEKESLSGLPVYVDPEGLEKSLGYGAIPLTLLLKDGTILAVHNGYSPEIMSALSGEIGRALGHQPRPAL